MLVVVSPAKKMNMDPVEGLEPTRPAFQVQADELAKVAQGLSVDDLQKLMKISENLAKLNRDRFNDFGEMQDKPAALAFAGDTYQGLEAASLDDDEMMWAQDHFRILSGLYGLLRPLDAIQPYRLEMGSRLKTVKGKTLYDYWGDTIARALNEQAQAIKAEVLVNCASQEYFGAVDLSALNLRVVTPVFMEEKPGGPKIVSFYAKRARGAMARYIIQRRLTDPEALTEFDTGGYRYVPDISEPDKPVFVRPPED
ncbi:peroxide stress protein YaaA [Roseovarius sp. PS-C2]|uniref:peroxide stress protein YaaA n=1 Tax=Roseovarius sp. PS-C2 TaxID=2820814 RepID=UPI001C0ADA12|nr:peroxide stress protein YaaA [Roseovarius sp. PS-C2]MBU3260682.1 peroxide stress protein YaaA [Roseovarius sp. PS-C2]